MALENFGNGYDTSHPFISLFLAQLDMASFLGKDILRGKEISWQGKSVVVLGAIAGTTLYGMLAKHVLDRMARSFTKNKKVFTLKCAGSAALILSVVEASTRLAGNEETVKAMLVLEEVLLSPLLHFTKKYYEKWK